MFLLSIICWGIAAQAAVTAHVDRFNVSEGETVNLSIEVTGDDSGDPQTSALQKDFEILSNSKRSSYSFINGASSSKTTYELMLRPRHTGALTIPSLKVGAAVTDPILIQVSKMPARSSPAGQPTGDVWISMDIEPARVRVQQQAVITIRVYQAVGLNNAQLTEPKADNAIIERLGDDVSYQKRENNRTWQVTERHYALFPQHSGRITIEPVQLDGSALVGGTSFFQTARPIRVRSNALTLDVGAIPDNWAGDAWLPARDLHIEETWPQGHPTFKVGEPITRTLTLHADGLSASQLPELPHDFPDHLKSYPDKPVLRDGKLSDGVHGMRQEKIAIMPMQAGTYILPEIDIAWWNTTTQKTEHAVLPARTFTVLAAPASASAPAPTQKSQPAAEDIHPQAPVQVQAAGASSWWQWLALFFATGWLLTLVYVWYLRRNSSARQQEEIDSCAVNIKQAVKAVKNACRANDAKACEQALLQLAHARKPGLQYHSLAALAAISGDALRAELIRLEQVLYGPEGTPWQGDALLDALNREGGFKETSGDSKPDQNSLPGLYPE